MKIRNVSCTQFAGVRDRNVALADGINVIYGKNESGKSTLVNLLSRTLFQNVRIDKRSDKEFVELYFPGARKNGTAVGDFIDGKVTFDTDRGTYTLSKEWGADARCSLTTPDGVIREQTKIDAILKEALLYGEGVYADMLFSSQRNTDISLQTILDASKKTDAKQEIASAVTQAFAESDGIPVELIEQSINKKIEEIAGKHWDIEKGIPVRKAGRWANGLGEILKAYYDLEDAKNVLKEIAWLESEADRAADDYAAKEAAMVKSEAEYTRFSNFTNILTVQSERRKTITRLEAELRKIEEILVSWPKLESDLNAAKMLQIERSNREMLDKYDAAKKIYDELQLVDTSILDRPCPTDSEIMQVKNAQRNVTMLENKLCGMNLNAAIKMFSGHSIEVTSLRTGENIDINGDVAQITEAVKIIVPGVIEMQLSPANVDVASIEKQIAIQKQIIDDVYAKYNVSSVAELESLSRSVSTARMMSENARGRLTLLLEGVTFEELKASVELIIGETRAKVDIDRDILMLCRTNDVARFITAKETIAAGYATDYISVPELKSKAYDLELELRKAKDSLSTATDIPAEYLSVTDPESYLDGLHREYRFKQNMRDEAFKLKSSTSGKLEAYKETLKGDPADEVEKAERVFEEQKALLDHWLHIAEVFKCLKEDIHDNPLQDIAERFAYNLEIISNGRVTSEFPEADKLNMEIYSENNLLDYGKLSEGTKETVSLAFRLAVLDHLFPDGGGVIVLDDPFTDMDAERTEGACELLKDCAERHQIVFLTCKEEYLDMLTGNLIQV